MSLSRVAEKPDALPTIVIEPRQGWRNLGLGEVWAHRELLFYFVWRDLKVRYKQTFFGAAWAVLQPLVMMGVFSVSLGRIPGIGPSGLPYPLFLFAALVPWTLFAQSLAGAANSLVAGEAIITKVYFPRLLMPFSAVGSFLVDYVVTLGVLVVLMLVFGVVPTASFLWVPAFTALTLVAALAVGTFLAAVNVRYRDVRYVVPFLVQIWLFASPVVYSSGLVPTELRTIYALNPMAGAVEGFRWAVFGGDRPDEIILLSALVAVVGLVAALFYFRRVERGFADVI